MIEVIIRHAESDAELGRITIENVSDLQDDEYADYSVRFGVDRAEGLGIHQRGIYKFPRHRYNVFGLLRQALNTLEPSDLELDGCDRANQIRKKRLGWRNR
jgi:hypothetical protein